MKAYQAPYNPDVVVLDPAHGGEDEGAKLGGAGSEKDFNLAFADRLGGLLTARGFTVVSTRTAGSDKVTGDQRAELANRSRAVACLLLHATSTGRGVHLYTSALAGTSAGGDVTAMDPLPWDSAQAASVAKSQKLSNELSTAMNGLKVPMISQRVSVAPLDSMMCPAVGLELAPEKTGGRVDDDGYQERVAESVSTALTYWRQHARDEIAAAQTAAQNAAEAASAATSRSAPVAPKPKPKPTIVKPPDEQPLLPDSSEPTQKPAPIERKPPAGEQRP